MTYPTHTWTPVADHATGQVCRGCCAAGAVRPSTKRYGSCRTDWPDHTGGVSHWCATHYGPAATAQGGDMALRDAEHCDTRADIEHLLAVARGNGHLIDEWVLAGYVRALEGKLEEYGHLASYEGGAL